jgi:hypothetical protein
MRYESLKIITGLILTVVILMSLTAYVVAYRSSLRSVEITVTDKARITKGNRDSVSGYYLVYSNDGVYQVSDSILFLTWNSSDKYGKIEPGNIYNVKVAGWRIPVFSMYPNIIEVVK